MSAFIAWLALKNLHSFTASPHRRSSYDGWSSDGKYTRREENKYYGDNGQIVEAALWKASFFIHNIVITSVIGYNECNILQEKNGIRSTRFREWPI